VKVTGTVFTDWNGDGKRASREPATAGRVVYVDINNNAQRDAGEPSATTTASGQYTLSLVPGHYTLRQVLPAGWYETAPANAGDHGVTVSTAGAAGAVNFAAARYSSISGVVFRDANRNGRRDTGEAGIGGWTVFIDANNNGWWDKNEAKTVTKSDGSWSFGNLKVGIYNVRPQQLNFSMVRTTASYYKHQLWSGTTVKGDNFGYVPR